MQRAHTFVIPRSFGFPAFELIGDCWPWQNHALQGMVNAIDQAGTFLCYKTEYHRVTAFSGAGETMTTQRAGL